MYVGKILEQLSSDVTEMKVAMGVLSTKIDTICKYHEAHFIKNDEEIKQLQIDQKTTNDYIASSSGALKLSAWLVAMVIALVGIWIAFVPK